MSPWHVHEHSNDGGKGEPHNIVSILKGKEMPGSINRMLTLVMGGTAHRM